MDKFPHVEFHILCVQTKLQSGRKKRKKMRNAVKDVGGSRQEQAGDKNSLLIKICQVTRYISPHPHN